MERFGIKSTSTNSLSIHYMTDTLLGAQDAPIYITDIVSLIVILTVWCKKVNLTDKVISEEVIKRERGSLLDS